MYINFKINIRNKNTLVKHIYPRKQIVVKLIMTVSKFSLCSMFAIIHLCCGLLVLTSQLVSEGK